MNGYLEQVVVIDLLFQVQIHILQIQMLESELQRQVLDYIVTIQQQMLLLGLNQVIIKYGLICMMMEVALMVLY